MQFSVGGGIPKFTSVPCKSRQQKCLFKVKLVLDSLCQSKKIAMATHNIYAYRIIQNDQSDVYYQGCEDDGETQAGSRMLHLMQVFSLRDV